MPAKELFKPCVDCSDAESVANVRSRSLCKYVVIAKYSRRDPVANMRYFASYRACFERYVSLKVLRRIENYRRPKSIPNGERHKLLLPLSFGLSSSVLLHIVNAQMERQLSKPYPLVGFEIHVLVIEPSTISPASSFADERFDLVQKSFPRHSYKKVPFHSIFDYQPKICDVISQFAGEGYVDDASRTNQERLDAFRASISTATSKVDVDQILLNRLIVAYGKDIGCDALLWGDSDSRLAAKTLANVAKGRGSSLTWQVSDGTSPSSLLFHFPLRDLFRTELQNYASLIPELSAIVIPDEPPSDNVLTKNLSIDELMMRYVQTHGEKYPGVMANVTRTANKLQPAPVPADSLRCSFCDACMDEQRDNDTGTKPRFCYACIRSRPDLVC